MANKQAYLDSLEICQKAQEKAIKIANAIIDNVEESNEIVEDSIACFLEDAYYNGVPEKQEMALFELVYEKAVAKKEKKEEEDYLLDETDSFKTEVEENVSLEEDINTFDSNDIDLEGKMPIESIKDSVLNDTPNINKEIIGLVPISNDFPSEEKTVDIVADKNDNFNEADEADNADEAGEEYSEMAVEYDSSESGFISEKDENELRDVDDIIDEEDDISSQKPSLIKKIIPGIIYVVLGLIIIWLIIGLLINSGKIEPIDLGYTWFNDTFFRAFFLD